MLTEEALGDKTASNSRRCDRDCLLGTVCVAILAKDKSATLPLYLECLENLDYPKNLISLYVRTNNNNDDTASILRCWIARVAHLYARVEFDDSDVPEQVQRFKPHEWNSERFIVLGAIRNESLRQAEEWGCDFYFVADCDNFFIPATLRELAMRNLPIVAPMLGKLKEEEYGFYANYHYDTDPNGYCGNSPHYHPLFERAIRGLVLVEVVHCTYLIRTDVLPLLTYDDASYRYEYVVFSHSARRHRVGQYLDNTYVYGYLTVRDEPGEFPDRFDEALMRRRLSEAAADYEAQSMHSLPDAAAP
ncbi:Glycosyltransferase family 2 [uncultured virus]|nr:Glycosyltransferase family 2 [uncultured virus]